jgi:hypothetical protein
MYFGHAWTTVEISQKCGSATSCSPFGACHPWIYRQIETLFAAEHEKRSADAQSLELKAKFLEVADQYRDLALQLDDPEKWRAKRTESREAKQK